MRRPTTAWVAFVATLAIFAAGLALDPLQDHGREVARQEAVQTARRLAALVVDQNLDPRGLGDEVLTPAERSALDQDLSMLLAAGRLVGFEVWREDGSLLFADHAHPAHETTLPRQELLRSWRGEAWVQASPETAQRGVRAREVFLPYVAGDAGARGGLVEVLLPSRAPRFAG